MKNYKDLTAQLAEAQVSTSKYSWGTMKTVHDGSKTSYPLHPEHQAIVKRLRPSGEHAKAMYKDETGARVHVTREGDKVHFVSHKKTGSHKTTVDYKHFDEEVELIENAPELQHDILKNHGVGGKTWSKGEHNQSYSGAKLQSKERPESLHKHLTDHGYKYKQDDHMGSVKHVWSKGDKVVAHVTGKNAAIHVSHDGDQFADPTKKTHNEEVELSENAPFKKLEHAVAYATDKVKTHRDNLDGIEVYKHKSGGYDVNHTMNASGRNSLNKTGAKHLGTVYKDKPVNIKEEQMDIKSFKEHADLGDYSKRHTVVAHVSDNTGTPADGEKRAIEKKALSVLAATPKHAEKAAHKHFSDKGYKVHSVVAKSAPSMKKEEVEQVEEDNKHLDSAGIKARQHAKYPDATDKEKDMINRGFGHMVDNARNPNGPQAKSMPKKSVKEEAEQIDEISNKTLRSYIKHASGDRDAYVSQAASAREAGDLKTRASSMARGIKRVHGIVNARKRLNKEETEIEEARLFSSHQEASAAARPGQKPKLDPNTNKYVLVSENKGLDISKVAHAGDKPHEEDWVDAKKKNETPPFDPDPKSSFKKAKNPNRTGMDAAKALAQRGMKEDKEEGTMKTYNEFLQSLEEKLIGKQKKLDKNHNDELDSQDFKMLRKEEAEELDEIKLADLPRRTVKGTSYGAQYHDPEGDDDADNRKPAKAADAPKRGRGRPAGAMSGARQKGSAKQSKTGGVDYTGYKLHLPNSNK